MKKNKTKTKIVKFGLNDLMNAGMALVVLGIAISYGSNIMSDVKSGFCGTGANGAAGVFNKTNGFCYIGNGKGANKTGVYTAEYNATHSGQKGLTVITSKMETLATIVVASVIIGVLVNFLWARFAQ